MCYKVEGDGISVNEVKSRPIRYAVCNSRLLSKKLLSKRFAWLGQKNIDEDARQDDTCQRMGLQQESQKMLHKNYSDEDRSEQRDASYRPDLAAEQPSRQTEMGV